jgi:threonine/homoserine/homoserine lactone efflux protein
MSATEFTALLMLCGALSFTPGPNTTVAAALGANGGLRHALPFVAGVPVGWMCLYALSAAGVAALLLAQPVLRWVVQGLGLASLLWLAWQLARSAQMGQAASAQLQFGFWQAVGLQFVNIKAWMIAVSIVAGWVAGQPQALVRFVTVLPVMAFFALASNLAYAALGSLLRHWLAQGRRLLMFNRCMAALLAATALWMLWRWTQGAA